MQIADELYKNYTDEKLDKIFAGSIEKIEKIEKAVHLRFFQNQNILHSIIK